MSAAADSDRVRAAAGWRVPVFNPTLRQRLERCNTLPTLPGAAARIIELGQDPCASMSDVADAVKMDPALAAKVLRMANSPLYARRRSCDSFQQALVLLGLDATLTLALTFSLVSTLGAESGRGLDYNRVWRRSLLAAIAARVLGEHLGLRSPEEALLAGLLQDLGMLAMDRGYPELYDALAPDEQDHAVITSLEHVHIGCDHASVGAWLLARWNLPEKLLRAVAGSHDLDACAADDDDQVALLARAVALSGPLADLWMSLDPGASLADLQQQFSRVGGMDGTTLSLLVEKVAQAAPQIEKLFEMAILDPVRSEWILQEAREVIVLRNLQMVHESARLREVAASLQAQARSLEEKSRRDNLTGAFNRGHLDGVLADWFADANKAGIPLSVVFVDLDNFKLVNDRHGHQAGDRVLVKSAQILTALARGTDLVARYGGEEFVLLLPGCGADGTRRLCERLLEAFRGAEYQTEDGSRLVVTVSMGIATHGERVHFDSCQQLLRGADQALYAAKQGGRDRYTEFSVAA
jgi:diguanylate cyclase (GGDEF)-like protein